ncbi:MAG: family 10 glycosylhydrolase, partial [Bacteroidota bacterium]
MKFKIYFFIAITILFSFCKNNVTKETSTPVATRGVWLTNVVSDAMSSKEKINEAVELIHQYGFNTVFVVTWNRGYTLYPSATMEEKFGVKIDPKFEGRDLLQEVIDAAKQRDIKVIAWFEFGFSSAYEEADGGHILRKKPEWAARDSTGNIVSKNGFQWMNGFHPDVQNFMLSLLKEVANNYQVNGIQGDDRLPALPSLAGYEDWTLEKYKKEHQGNPPPNDPFNVAWVNWRADLMNDFMERMHRELKSTRPDLVISVSPSIYPWSKEQYLQDWPTWVKNGWVDMVCPQIYRYDLEKYQAELKKIMTEQVNENNHSLIVPGILARVGDYYASDTLLQSFVEENRKYGIQGEVFFYYEALKKNHSFYNSLYQDVATAQEFPLASPIITSDVVFFEKANPVKLTLGMEGVNIHYTTDGSEPSENDPIYQTEILLEKTTTVKARAFHPDYLPSETAAAQFVQLGKVFKIKNTSLNRTPHENYPGVGAEGLTDRKKGTTTFRTPLWMGFEGGNLEAIIEFENKEKISKITTSLLSDPGSWIFMPRAVEVYGSMDGENYDLLKNVELPETKA